MCTPPPPRPTPPLLVYVLSSSSSSCPFPPLLTGSKLSTPRYINSNDIPAENAIRLISGINVVFKDLVVMTRSTNFPYKLKLLLQV